MKSMRKLISVDVINRNILPGKEDGAAERLQLSTESARRRYQRTRGSKRRADKVLKSQQPIHIARGASAQILVRIPDQQFRL